MTLKLAIVSIPTAGHIKPLIRLCQSLKEHGNVGLTFILTSWKGYRMNMMDFNDLQIIVDHLVVLEAANEISRPDIYARAIALTDSVITHCAGHHHVLFDFMTPEGYLAGKFLKIPVTGVNPSFIGRFDPDGDEFKKHVKVNQNNIENLEQKYQLPLMENIQLISNQLSIQAPVNIVFSWAELILSPEFSHHREQYQYHFMRPAKESYELKGFEYLAAAKKEQKKIVYFSLGTIAPGIAWDVLDNSLHAFIKSLYDHLINIAARRSDLLFIFAACRNPNDIIGDANLPPNVRLYEFVPQSLLLPHIDLFITHCGGNSTNEAIDSKIPMIGIPLMFDQHECAERIAELGLGIAFLHSHDNRAQAAYLESDLYFREGLTELALENAIDNILSTSEFKENLIKIDTNNKSTLLFSEMMSVIKRSPGEI